ncbi:ATP-binding cassette domain-containing protein [Flavobacterium crassostreae]|uniref:ABC transporter n=1 Tax=Flavobacterium crassostreae TaxID=1763534 RepID=A0A1B9DN66_9FLAO|nr:ATP-binding cassette domain-containing protein [Flavobacterium crassostreae]OCB71136.1 ABC transporter [Flavobacterium crassostreae]
MQQLQHLGIFLSNQVDKNKFINTLISNQATGKLSIYNHQKGMVFSDATINAFIQKEHQYNALSSALDTNRKLQTYSSGERKKVFLNYCIHQQPEYLILDNPLDHLDQKSRQTIINTLQQLTQKTQIILLANRMVDLDILEIPKAAVDDNSFDLKLLKSIITPAHHFLATQIPAPLEPIFLDQDILVKMTNLCVHYHQKPILNQINWTIKKGEFWHLLGPNGSGKSTLLSLITGENTKGYGQDLHLFGFQKGSGETIWDIKKNIGYFSTAMIEVFQTNNTLEQMVLSGFFDSIGLYSQASDLQLNIVQQWLELLGLSAHKNTAFKTLSIGQQRLALIVRAVIKHPPLLILDEPLEGLDDTNVSLVAQLINHLSQHTNLSILYVSHRKEPNIHPKTIYQLTPNNKGTTGAIHP